MSDRNFADPYGGQPGFSQEIRHVRPWWRLWLLVMFLYPAIVVVLIYASWFATWIEIGAPPVPLRDGSDHIVVWTLQALAMIGILQSPVALIVGFVCAYRYPFAGCGRPDRMVARLGSVGLFLMVGAAMCLLPYWDPGGVFLWFLD